MICIRGGRWLLLAALLASCATARTGDDALLDDVEQRTFHFFWDLADSHTYLIPDRAPTPSFSSIAASHDTSLADELPPPDALLAY